MRSFFATLLKLVIPGGAGPTSDRIEIGGELPADLVAYYQSESYTPIGGIVLFHPTNEYDYIILALNASGVATLCIGVRNSFGVVDAIQIRPSAGLPLPRVTFGEFADNPGQIIIGSLFSIDTFGAINMSSGSALAGDAGATFEYVDMRHAGNTTGAGSSTSSTTFANLTNICGVAFVAPASGIVTIHFVTRLENSSAAGGALMAPWVGTGTTVGSGTEVVAALVENSIIFFQHSTAAEALRMGAFLRVTGLTPGAEYNVSMRVRAASGGGTASFDDIGVVVVPSP